jgi:hypothetical protein
MGAAKLQAYAEEKYDVFLTWTKLKSSEDDFSKLILES